MQFRQKNGNVSLRVDVDGAAILATAKYEDASGEMKVVRSIESDRWRNRTMLLPVYARVEAIGALERLSAVMAQEGLVGPANGKRFNAAAASISALKDYARNVEGEISRALIDGQAVFQAGRADQVIDAIMEGGKPALSLAKTVLMIADKSSGITLTDALDGADDASRRMSMSLINDSVALTLAPTELERMLTAAEPALSSADVSRPQGALGLG